MSNTMFGVDVPASTAVGPVAAARQAEALGYEDDLPAMRDRVAAAAEGAGRSIDDITCALNVEVRVEVRVGAERPGIVAGAPDQVADRLRALTAIGFTVLNLKPSGPGRDEQVERLAREVLPQLR